MKDPRKLAEQFVAGLEGDMGARLLSAALFGSAARDEWLEGTSDVNVLVLVDTIDAALLAKASATVRNFVKRGVMPLIMAQDEWRRAGDVFAIELADMRDAHVPLLGEDPVAHYVAERTSLRLQAERELRAKLLHLHGGMLLAGDDRKRLGPLFQHALPSFATYMRAALRLAGQSVPATTPHVIERACALAGADDKPFLRVHNARTRKEKLEVAAGDPLADQFNSSAQRLADYIDAQGRQDANDS